MLPVSYYAAISAKRAAERVEHYRNTHPADGSLRFAGLPAPRAFQLGRDTAHHDPEYADVDTDGQLALGVAGDQRAIPGLARPRQEG